MSDPGLTTQQLAELHLHLEGTIRRETAVALSARNGLPEPPTYEYSDLSGFLAVYMQVSRCMVTSQDFERVIFEHGVAMAAQHITYAEISFNPSLHPPAGWVDRIRGRESSRGVGTVMVGWLFAAGPQLPMTNAWYRAYHRGIVGVGMVGDGVDLRSAPLAWLSVCAADSIHAPMPGGF